MTPSIPQRPTAEPPFDLDGTEIYARRAVADLPFTAGAFALWLTEASNEATFHGRARSHVRFDVGEDGRIYVNVLKVTGTSAEVRG